MQEENILWIKEKTKITYSCDIEIELIRRDLHGKINKVN